jgi:hypothetical protein
MQMDISVDPGQRFTRCTVSGPLNPDQAQGLFQSFREKVEASTPKRLLLDLLAMTGAFQILDQYQIGNTSTEAFRHFERVAVVQHERVNSGFGALVAKNRGLNIQVFAVEDDALRWLLG